MVLTPGLLVGSHMMICGLMLNGAATAIDGLAVDWLTASSVPTNPRRISSGFSYMAAIGRPYPMAGPPART
ncbi:unannotated protein [freshwater metagenome]|uniref:Unannotated protein n=1 Tax=freshwater metagenome TaxID=449393 RepID=A0A6J6JP53_9ZZZZ